MLVSILSGLALSLAFPPAGLWPVAFVALAPFLWTLREGGALRRLALGLAFGAAFFGATLYWILRFGFLAWSGLTTDSALAVSLFALLAVVARRPGRPLVTAVGLAAVWTVVDWLRSMFPLGGFTWGALGVSQVDNRATLRLASVAGVWGVTFVVALVNALLVEAWVGGGGGGRRAARVALAAAAALAPLSIPFPTAEGQAVRIATVQVDVRRAVGADADAIDRAVARLNEAMHARLAADPPDLAIWGEGALDPGAANDPAALARVRRTIAEVGAPTVVGAVTDDPDGQERTDVLAFDGRGRLSARYDKVHLVPFGEYVPWRRYLSWISALEQIPVDRAPGTRIHTIRLGGMPAFGTPICFENAFPSLTRAFVLDGAAFMVVPVNNASYGSTAASAQHLQMSRVRAVEDGRWFVDAAVSGESAFIDPSGEVVARTGLFRSAILRHTVRASSAHTPYVRLGDWFPWLALALALGLFAAPARRRGGRPTPEELPPSARRTLVVLPTYDERETIEWVLARLLALPGRIEVLVVDDTSPDGTSELVRAMAVDEPRLRLLVRPAKAGLASAYLTGFRDGLAGAYDLVVEMDSDLSHEPEELPLLIDGAARGLDLAIGSRYIPGGSVTNWSRARLALSRAGNAYARRMLGLPARDATSGYRVYRRELLEELVRRPFRSDGYGFQIELVMRANDLGFTVGEAPITFREREHGHSKLSRRIVVEALWLVTVWGVRRRLGALRGGSTGGPGESP